MIGWNGRAMEMFKDIFYLGMGFVMGVGFGLILVVYVAQVIFGFGCHG